MVCRTPPIEAVLLKEVTAQVRNLGAGGCLLETRVSLGAGTIGILYMELDGELRVEWFRICRVQPVHGRSGAQLAGAEFLRLAAAGDHSLRGVIRRLQKAGAIPGVRSLSRRSSGHSGKSLAIPLTVLAEQTGSWAFSLNELAHSLAGSSAPQLAAPLLDLGRVDLPNYGGSDQGEAHMKRLIVRLVRDERGQDLIEYVLIGSFVSIGALAGATVLGVNLDGWYTAVSDWVKAAAGKVGTP